MSGKGSQELSEGIPSVAGSTVPLNLKNEGFAVRKIQALLLFSMFFVAYFLRTNLSVAIVAMTRSNRTGSLDNEFGWDEKIKGNVLSSFFWGYLVIQVPAGLLGQVISPKTLLIVTNTICSLLAIITPIAARYGEWPMLCTVRVLQGLSQGFFVPLTYTLASKWAPVTEQNRFIGFTLNGGTLGATAVMPISGYLANQSGWPSIFYLSGAIGLVWVVFWVCYGADSPAMYSKISPAEKEFIETSLQHNSNEHIPIPWTKIFMSPALWALVAAHIGCGWTFSIIFTQMPTYIHSILGFDISTNGLLSAIPYLTMWCVSFPACWLADYMYERQIFKTSTLRKIWATISGSLAGLTLLSVAFVGHNAVAAMILLVIAVSLTSCAFAGVYVNPLDLAPNFAGVLTGISNGLENVSSILGPLSVGWIMDDETSVQQWMTVFLVAVIVDVAGNLIYVIWGTAKLQSWNEPKTSKEISNNSAIQQHTPPPVYSIST